jgi:predicted tellurium resistance membrane protein TerC
MQIVVLNAMFSFDSVITSVGMVDELPILMAAVVISTGIMLVSSKQLTRFINAHPKLVVLCLSFLLMIALALVAEALGFDLPKACLCAAIGFSVVMEFSTNAQAATRSSSSCAGRSENALLNRCFAYSGVGGKSRPTTTQSLRKYPWKHRCSLSKNAT